MLWLPILHRNSKTRLNWILNYYPVLIMVGKIIGIINEAQKLVVIEVLMIQ